MTRWYIRRGKRREDLITASEVACFAYCPEQWRLEHGLGLPPGNRAALDAGTRYHAGLAAAERLAGWSIHLGQVMVLAALLALLLWVFTR
jgi:PD-(D/E)XK nuclease superfamily